MYEDAQKAYDELRNAVWMVAVSLCMGMLSLVGACQWVIQDIQWEDRIEEINQARTGVIQEVEASECTQPRPAGEGHLCAHIPSGGLRLTIRIASEDNATHQLGGWM